MLDELNGPLATDLCISGSIKADLATIYISENAFVKNIHILNGAQIEGDIISNWCPESMDDMWYYGKKDLSTNLVFGNNSDKITNKNYITVKGNITAKGMLDVSIQNNTRLNYYGKMSKLRRFNARPGAIFSVDADITNLVTSVVEAQEIKFDQKSKIIVTCDSLFAYKSEETVTILELVSKKINKDAETIPCSYEGKNITSVGFYNGVFIPTLSPNFTKSQNGLTLNLILKPNSALSVSRERTAVKATGAPLIVAAYNMSANTIFNRIELTPDKKETNTWCSPDIAFGTQAKTDSKYSANSKATVFGIDTKITGYLLLGAGGDFAFQKYASNDANVDVEHSSGFVYGATNILEEINLSFFIKGGRNSYSQNRSVEEEKYHTDYKGNQYNLGLKIDHPLRRMREKIKIKPFASYECILLDVDSYGEGKGKYYALKFDKSATKTHRMNIGTEVKCNITKTIDLNTSVFYSSLYGDRNTNVLVRFTQREDVSEISHGDELDKHSIVVDTNFKIKPTKHTNVTLGYALTAGKNCTNNQINAIFSLKF